MIRRIEDIIPPDRPEETRPPRARRVIPDPRADEPESESQEVFRPDPRIDHELPAFERERESAERHIDDPPPFVSKILPREIGENAFFDRRRAEREPLHVATVPQKGVQASLRRYLFPAAAGLIVILYLVLSVMFHRVTVEVTPKAERVVFNAKLSASKDVPEGLSFSVFSLSATRTKDIAAKETKNVSVKASGKIVVYNEYSSASQRLIKNTRFQAADGSIYRIAESIVVPGLTVVDGKTVPGRIEVTVYADEPGDKWNIPLTDFTIPGLKGDPRFQKMYARSKTPMTGGWIGEMRIVSDEDLAAAREEIRSALENELRVRAHESVPENYVMYDEGTYVVTRPLAQEELPGEESMVRLTGEATLHAVMFPRAALAKALAGDAVPGYDGAPVSVRDIELLRASVTPKDEGDPWTAKGISLAITGDTDIVWNVDSAALVQALAGKPKGAFEPTLADFPSIDGAAAGFRPFWWPGSFPADADRIAVEVKAP